MFIKPQEPRATKVANEIAAWAADKNIELFIKDRATEIPENAYSASEKEIASLCGLIVALGGDGTMLGVARAIGGCGTPVLGINLGTLGYLTEFSVEEAIPALENFLRGEYQITHRTLIDWQVVRQSQIIGSGSALNDVVVNKATLARMIELDFSASNAPVTTYRADGLIVATPTGSTAYNLSAGGPIIYPSVGAIAIAPICPHTLTNRPLILPDTADIKLELKTHGQEVMLASDGQVSVQLKVGDVIEIRKSEKTFNTIVAKGHNYFEILRSKLKWSGR
ncbi:MAG: NAD(+)/NADH kinase [Acidobacteriota bacterium]